MKLRRLGDFGPEVSAIGLGCMGMSDFYGPTDEKESLATIHEAWMQGLPYLTPEISTAPAGTKC